MELRDYWSIIRRRLWIIVAIVVIVALYSGYQYYKLHKTPGALKTSQSQVTLLIGLQDNSGLTDKSNYSDYVSVSETLADAYTTGQTLTLPNFDHLVYQQIVADEGQSGMSNLGGLQEGNIGGALSASRYHSLVTVTATWPNAAGAQAIAKAVGEVTAAHIDSYLDYVVTNNPSSATNGSTRPIVAAKVVTGATAPVTVAGSSASKPALLVALVLVGLIIGIALAFLIEYLDDRIRRANDVAQLLQLPVYGEIPHAPTPGQASSRKA